MYSAGALWSAQCLGLRRRHVPCRSSALQGALAGAINAMIIIGAIAVAEVFLSPTRLCHALERLPFLVIFAVKLLTYGTVIVLIVKGRPGARIAAIGAGCLCAMSERERSIPLELHRKL